MNMNNPHFKLHLWIQIYFVCQHMLQLPKWVELRAACFSFNRSAMSKMLHTMQRLKYLRQWQFWRAHKTYKTFWYAHRSSWQYQHFIVILQSDTRSDSNHTPNVFERQILHIAMFRSIERISTYGRYRHIENVMLMYGSCFGWYLQSVLSIGYSWPS